MTRPFVSVVTPTRDRREFLPQLFRYFLAQTYPADRMELIVVDDGVDKVADLIPDDPRIRYEALDARVPLGTKRNRLCALAKGEILVHMDDDDVYPPDRVEKAVAHLEETGAELVGKSALAFWDLATGKVHQYPAIGDSHATAGSMAYWRSYWEGRHWAPDPHTEERQFTRCWDAKLAQLPGEPWETVLAVFHGGNILPKNTDMPVLPLTPLDIIGDPGIVRFYEDALDDDW